MKKIYINLFLLLFPTLAAFSQTTISGGIVNGKWTKANSPYNITGSIQIINGDSLLIEPGVTVSFQGTYKFLVLGKLIAIGTPKDTIIFTAANKTDGWRGIRFDNTPSSNDTSRIMYCKIQYGNTIGTLTPEQSGGGLYFYYFSKAVVSYSSIINCNAQSGGGGIYISHASPVIKWNYIANNSASGGGGIVVESGTPAIEFNIIKKNKAISYEGGGISIYRCDPIVNFNIISNNTASSSEEGGGIYIYHGSPIVSNNNITENISGEGGGIYIEYGSPLITNNFISNNASGWGGAICLENSSQQDNPEITFNNITNNTAKDGGGGIALGGHALIDHNFIYKNTAGMYGGGGISGARDNTTISNNIISNNRVNFFSSQQNGGGGIVCSGNYKVLIINNLIINNNAPKGGGILSFGSPTFTNNTIANNISSEGGAFYCSAGNPNLNNCIFWGNTSTKSGTQVFIYDEISDPNFYNCDVQGGSSAFELNGNFYTGTYKNNINKNPLFLDPSGGAGETYDGVAANWNLDGNSPCRDSGKPGDDYPVSDIAGNKRIANRIIDMGAYEFPVILTDAGIQLISPNTSFECGKIKLPITVQLSNFGDETIKGVNIVLKINGVVKKSISWTGFLLPLRDSSFTIDSFLFDTSNAYDVSVFSSKPNSIADTFNTNDTAKTLVRVYPKPDAAFSFKIINDTVAFSRNSTSSATSVWQFGDGNSSTQNNPSHIYTHARYYKVSHTITSSNVCNQTYEDWVNVMVANLSLFSKPNNLLVYPNPFNTATTVQYNLVKPSKVTLKIYDVSGKLINSSDLGLMSSGNHTSLIDVSKLLTGVYLLKVNAGDVNMYCRLLKN